MIRSNILINSSPVFHIFENELQIIFISFYKQPYSIFSITMNSPLKECNNVVMAYLLSNWTMCGDEIGHASLIP